MKSAAVVTKWHWFLSNRDSDTLKCVLVTGNIFLPACTPSKTCWLEYVIYQSHTHTLTNNHLSSCCHLWTHTHLDFSTCCSTPTREEMSTDDVCTYAPTVITAFSALTSTIHPQPYSLLTSVLPRVLICLLIKLSFLPSVPQCPSSLILSSLDSQSCCCRKKTEDEKLKNFNQLISLFIVFWSLFISITH